MAEPILGVSSELNKVCARLTLGVGGVDRLGQSLLETLRGNFLNSLGDERRAGGVRDGSVGGGIGVVDRVGEGVLKTLGGVLLDRVGDDGLTLRVDGVGSVGSGHCCWGVVFVVVWDELKVWVCE